MLFGGQEKKSKIKIVLDTNVIISALLWRGKTRELFQLAEEGRVVIFTSNKIIFELQRVILYPKFQTQIEQEGLFINDLIGRFVAITNIINDPYDLDIVKDDPSDNIFLSCALVINADYIITGDNHLLKLKQFQRIKILKPNELLNVLKNQLP